jgi:hypothetical protein
VDQRNLGADFKKINAILKQIKILRMQKDHIGNRGAV